MVDDGERFFFQPCFSPVWDTAHRRLSRWAQAGSRESGLLRRAADWLLTKEVRRKGDWSVKRPNTEPSGWSFEFANEFYPDIDDTAMVMLALNRSHASRPRRAAGLRPARHSSGCSTCSPKTAAGRRSTSITIGSS